MFPESRQGRHFSWLWELIQTAGSGLNTEDLDEHFSDLARAFPFVNTGALKGFAQNSFMVGAELRSVVVEEDSDRIVAAITTPSGLQLETCVSFDAEDGRIVAVTPRLARGASATAVVAAALRAAHMVVDGGSVLADTLAEALSGELGRAAIAGARANPSSPHPRWNAAARSRWAEDTLTELRHDGVDQYVILGAGLDSCAYRQRDPADGLRIFEVDHPVSQAWKRERLSRLDIAEPEFATYVPVDFETESFDVALVDAGFEPARPSVVAWLGVTYYLTRAAIHDALALVARCARGTTIILDYPVPERLLDSFGPPFDGNQARAISRIAEASGEPLISFFTADDVEALLRSEGYRDIEHLDHAAIRARYMGGQTTPVPGPVPFFAIVKATV